MQRDTGRERQRDRETEKQRNRETETHRDTQRHTYIHGYKDRDNFQSTLMHTHVFNDLFNNVEVHEMQKYKDHKKNFVSNKINVPPDTCII